MPRWIVFDQKTADELRSRLPHQAVFEAPGRTALEYALTAPRTVVAVLGPPINEETAIAIFRPGGGELTSAVDPDATPAASSSAVSPTTRASGFLGLSDHVVEFEENETPRRWWQFWR